MIEDRKLKEALAKEAQQIQLPADLLYRIQQHSGSVPRPSLWSRLRIGLRLEVAAACLVLAVLIGLVALRTLSGTPSPADQDSQPPPEAVGGLLMRMLSEDDGWRLQNGRLLRTQTGGIRWTVVTPPGAELTAVGNPQDLPVYFLDSDRAWAAENRNRGLTVYRTVDGGQSWDQVELDAEGEAQLHFVDDQHGWMLLHQGVAMGSEKVELLRTTDGGVTWTKIASAGPDAVHTDGSGLPFGGIKKGIAFRDPNVGWVTVEERVPGRVGLYRTSDGGLTWSQQELPIPEAYQSHSLTIHPPQFLTDSHAILPVTFVPGYQTVFYTSEDGGATWTATSPVRATNGSSSIIYDFLDAEHGWTLDGNSIFVTQDGGHSWTAFAAQNSIKGAKQLQFLSEQVGWAFTEAGVWRTNDGGRTWR